MAESERVLLSHYNIQTLEPWEWPADKDVGSDSSDLEDDSGDGISNSNKYDNNVQYNRFATFTPSNRSLAENSEFKPHHQSRPSRSRFSALERGIRSRTSVPGSQKVSDGVESLVQQDEPDPLGLVGGGGSGSVVQVLRQKGLPVDEDVRLRNRFLLSSTTFSPTMFLAQVHSNDSTESLLQGLDHLSRSIEMKSASLKILVESNFERFVRAKATIDNVYTEMRNHGSTPEDLASPSEIPSRKPHSRHVSKSSGHFRQGSYAGSNMPNAFKPLPSDKKKNALIKESEYGVQGIKVPLTEALVKAEEVWGPALGGKEREESLKAVLSLLDKHRDLFELAPSIQECLKLKDYEALVEQHTKAQRYVEEARSMVDAAMQSGKELTDSQIQLVTVTARMWGDVSQQIEAFKREVWRRLAGTHFAQKPVAEDDKPVAYMQLINILLELGVEDNPIWVWLLSRYDFLKNKITESAERFKLEVELVRRRLADQERPAVSVIAAHLRSVENNSQAGPANGIDSAAVIELWEHIVMCINGILAVPGGLLGEVLEFWTTAQSFVDGQAQSSLPRGLHGQSVKHHRLSADGVSSLRNGAIELVNIVREAVLSFFLEPPIDDISALLSPLTPAIDTPLSPASLSGSLSPRFKVDATHPVPPSPRTGESWEKFAFWPPHATVLSGVHYLGIIINIVATAASEMAMSAIVADAGRSTEPLKSLVGGVRERCIQAVCAAWKNDAEYCKALEDWTRPRERRNITKLPSRFVAFEKYVLTGMQKIIFVNNAEGKANKLAANRPGATDVIIPPLPKLLQMVRHQFVGSLYKSMSDMVVNAEKSKLNIDEDAEGVQEELLIIPSATVGSAYAIESLNKDIRILLTLSNLHYLQTDIIPQLISQFESGFSIKLTDEAKTVRDALTQIENRLFHNYVKPIAAHLASTIKHGIQSPKWEPKPGNRPRDASPYVYEILLALVVVHSQVSTTAAPLTSNILKHLQEQISLALLSALRERSRYELGALMQATLDVEFLAQTLSNYTTEAASETQSKIYLALDERTDNEARVKLQHELPEMRAILKKLRESTKGEFACFKKARQPREKTERPPNTERQTG